MGEITKEALDTISKECNLDFWQEELKKMDLTPLKEAYKRDYRLLETNGLIQYFLDNGQDFRQALIEVSKADNLSNFFYRSDLENRLKQILTEFLNRLMVCLLVNNFIKNLYSYYFYSKSVRIEKVIVEVPVETGSVYLRIIFRDLNSGEEKKVNLNIWYRKPGEVYTLNELINYLNANSRISMTINNLNYGSDESLKWLKIENLAHWLEVFGHIYKL